MRDDPLKAEAGSGYLGVKVISSWAGDTAAAATTTEGVEARWEETSDAIEFAQARIGDARAVHIDKLGVRIEQGQHTLVVGGTRPRRAALSAVLLGSTAHLVHGVMRSPRAHRGVVSVSMGRPYVRAGSSLWDLLVFPHDKSQSQRRGVEERHLDELLRFLGFESLLARVGDDWARVVDWAKVLDRRDRAALALCRLLYHAPPFALVDNDALAALLPTQVRQVLGAANMHHVTLVVLADTDPFDASPPSSSSSSATLTADAATSSPDAAATSSPGFIACLGEFSRALRLRPNCGWEFCSFGYGSPARAAFDATTEKRWVWTHDARGGRRELRARLQRRTSTLSQCSTTERRWLMTPEFPLSPGAERSASPMSRRQSSRVVSPVLSARSSVSDFAGTATMIDFGSIRSRLLTIDSAIAGLSRQPSTSALCESAPSESAHSEASVGEPVVNVPVLCAEQTKAEVAVSKPAETEPAETKPAETKPAEPKPAEPTAKLETGQAEIKSSDIEAFELNPAGLKAAEPKPSPAEPKSCSSEETLSDRSANRFARPRNYRRSTRPGMSLSPQSATSLTFIPPASHEQHPRVRSSNNNNNGEVSTAAAVVPAACSPEESPNGGGQRRFQGTMQSRPATAVNSPSRIPRAPSSSSASSARALHSRSSSCTGRSVCLSEAASVASGPSALPRPKHHPSGSPIDELTAALRNL